MFNDLKALVVVLVIATAVFAFGARVSEGFIDPVDFRRRRNVWFALTIAAFAAPSIWLFAAVAMPVMFFAARRDSNPLALYVLLMFVAPNTSIPLPTAGGIGQLFDINLSRMASFMILIPAVWGGRGLAPGKRKLTAMDVLLVAYCLLQVVLFVPYESPTNTLRRGLLLFIDTFIVYYAFSKLPPTRRAFGDIAATAVLLGGLLAPLAFFESIRGWLLYQQIPNQWGASNVFSYLMRGDSLRAQVSTGHSLVLGYTMSFCFAFWLYIQSQRPRPSSNAIVTVVLLAGLLASYSRGAWLMCILVAVAFLALRPGAGKVFVRVLPVLAVAGVIMYLSPLKEIVLDRLPLIGTSDQETVQYRQQVAEVSWRLIKLSPFLGDPFVTDSLEELRQGQGIIDLINGYIVVTLYSGFVGLTLFASFFIVAVWRCFWVMRAWRDKDFPNALIGASLVACMLASLFFIATAGFGAIEYLLAGLMASYAAMTAPQAVPFMNRRADAPSFVKAAARVRPASG